MIPIFLFGSTISSFSPLFNKFIVSIRAVFFYRLKAWGFMSNKCELSRILKESSSKRPMRMISSLIWVSFPAKSSETRQSHQGSKRFSWRYDSCFDFEDFFFIRGMKPGGRSFLIPFINSARVRMNEEEERSVDSRGTLRRANLQLVLKATLDFLQRVACMKMSINIRRVIELLFIYLALIAIKGPSDNFQCLLGWKEGLAKWKGRGQQSD